MTREEPSSCIIILLIRGILRIVFPVCVKGCSLDLQRYGYKLACLNCLYFIMNFANLSDPENSAALNESNFTLHQSDRVGCCVMFRG